MVNMFLLKDPAGYDRAPHPPPGQKVPLVMRRLLDQETPCTNGAPSARFSLRGNVITTFLLHAQRLDSNIVFAYQILL